MSYTKQNFQSGAVLYASQLNAMDDEIHRLSNDYVTPEMYGAVGDGVHDDAAALKSALESGKPVILTQNLHMFSSVAVREHNVYLDGHGYTVFLHGEGLPANVASGGDGGYFIDITSTWNDGVIAGADVIAYTEDSTDAMHPAFPTQNSYRRGYLSYHGFNPTPDKEVYESYTTHSWKEYRADIRNTRFIGDHTDGIKYLRLNLMCNSAVDNCDFICSTDDGGAIGVQGTYCYNLRLTNIRAEGFTAKTSRHVNNVGYGFQVFGDSILVQNCQIKNCKNHINVGGGSGASGIFTTGVIIDNLILQTTDRNDIVPGRTDRLYQQMLDLHEGIHHPLLSNIYLEYENCMEDGSWGILVNLSCPEATITNLYCKFAKPYSMYARGYFGFNQFAKRYDFNNVHAPGCYLFPTGWGYEREKAFDANYMAEIKFVGGEIGGVINRRKYRRGLYKIRMDGVHVSGLVDCPRLYAVGCVFKNISTPSAVPQIRIHHEGSLTGCDIYGYTLGNYARNTAVISAPEYGLTITGCIIRKPLNEILFDNEQHAENNTIYDLYGLILGCRVSDMYTDGDSCALGSFNLW